MSLCTPFTGMPTHLHSDPPKGAQKGAFRNSFPMPVRSRVFSSLKTLGALHSPCPLLPFLSSTNQLVRVTIVRNR